MEMAYQSSISLTEIQILKAFRLPSKISVKLFWESCFAKDWCGECCPPALRSVKELLLFSVGD